MEELLRPLGTKKKTSQSATPFLQESSVRNLRTVHRPETKDITSPDGALEALKSQPEYDNLVAVLRYLAAEHESWSILRPSAQAAQLVSCLASDVAQNYWSVLKEGSADTGASRTRAKGASDMSLFLSCLRSTAGINAVLRQLGDHLHEARKGVDMSLNMIATLDLLSALLEGNECLNDMWSGMTTGSDYDVTKRSLLSQEFTAVLGGGKIVSLSAEAQKAIKGTHKDEFDFWVSDGKEYSLWLTHNVVSWVEKGPAHDDMPICTGLLVKALRLGHPSSVMDELFSWLLRANASALKGFDQLMDGLPQSEQRRVLYGVLKLLSERFLNGLHGCEVEEMAAPVVSAAANVIRQIVGSVDSRRDDLASWLTGSSGAGMGEGVGIRRAALAVFSSDKDKVVTVLERSLNQFGDQLYIKHSPLLQQEAHTQVLLLSAAYVARMSPMKLKLNLRSSVWLNALSHRLAAPQARARFLGLVVGEALSSLVDGGDKKLDFQMEVTMSEEATWYKSLLKVNDSIASSSSILAEPERPDIKGRKKKAMEPIPRPKVVAPTQSPGFVIEEVDDDDEDDEDDDLVAYGKPDSDAEDSDDDPTLVRRDKPKAPVYIRNLIRYLRDTESYDHQRLGLATAPTLIRRKAHYGTEVKDHVEELASLLVGLQDKFDMDDFADMRLQGMIATVVAQPEMMGPWFAKTFFDGDYSISQRASILAVLGLSAREIAGYDESPFAAAASFPSRTLPQKVEKLYQGQGSLSGQLSAASNLKALPANALDHVARSVMSEFLAPIAATAADAATGPDTLKLTTYTSRLKRAQDSQPKAKRSGPAVRAIPNTTAQLLSTSFFFPLSARFQAALHATVSRTHGILFDPHLLPLFLRTLAVILHAAGPSTLALPDMTATLWGLLLSSSVRAQTVGDLGLTQAVLFALLALLDVNENRMRDLCRDMGREVVETQEWVGAIFEGTRGGDGAGEENEAKMMAAGILIRLNEGIEKYRLLLVGDMIDFG